ncbi:Tas retrotransposon peptidase A16 [Oesophagostomum dentatum]|uniref:Tas retrotransposon peptidase A16 n=1 Tax=Oesophagostomum dentatum TaxID=61180 RepID=A0A0B1TTJ6_OESDE|nr:Tas retrotransposon peptidase A16 [Oesophagostomum dentatum]
MVIPHPALTTSKQRITRHLNDIQQIISDCDKNKDGWNFPTVRKDLYIFVHTEKSIVQGIISKLELKIASVNTIYAETLAELGKAREQDSPVDYFQEFDEYWSEHNGELVLETARELIQNLEMRISELATQEMQISFADEFDVRESHRTNTPTIPELQGFPTTSFSSVVNPVPTISSQSVPPHWYRKELRIPDFYGHPTEFQPFWEIFSELVHKQSYTDIEKLTILLDKCKGEAARALKYLPRVGSSYSDAIKQLKDQFQNKEMDVQFLLNALSQIPQSSESPSQLRATVNDVMAIITPLARFETHIDAREYRSKVRQKFPPSIQRKLLEKEYDDNNPWTMETLMEEIRKLVKKYEVTQICNDRTATQPATVLRAQTTQSEVLKHRSPTPGPTRASSNRNNYIPAHVALTQDDNGFQSDEDGMVYVNHTNVSSNITSRMMIIVMNTRNLSTEKVESVYALLDTGSNRSFVLESLVKRFSLPSLPANSYILTTFGGEQQKRKCRKAALVTSDRFDNPVKFTLLTTNIITEHIKTPPLPSSDISFIRLHAIASNFLNLQPVDVFPEVLFGIDYYNELLDTSMSAYKLPSGLTAIPTVFGYVISGSLNNSYTSDVTHSLLNILPSTEGLPDLSLMWDLEGLGIRESISESEENEKILRTFYETIEIRGKQIYV